MSSIPIPIPCELDSDSGIFRDILLSHFTIPFYFICQCLLGLWNRSISIPILSRVDSNSDSNWKNSSRLIRFRFHQARNRVDSDSNSNSNSNSGIGNVLSLLWTVPVYVLIRPKFCNMVTFFWCFDLLSTAKRGRYALGSVRLSVCPSVRLFVCALTAEPV